MKGGDITEIAKTMSSRRICGFQNLKLIFIFEK
jgi:hypothetical protein